MYQPRGLPSVGVLLRLRELHFYPSLGDDASNEPPALLLAACLHAVRRALSRHVSTLHHIPYVLWTPAFGLGTVAYGYV
jgi:hypothetical protein